MAPTPANLARLYDEHAAALYVFLLGFTGQEADARDLLQEVFCKLAGRPALLDGARNARAVLLQTCYRLGIDWARRREVRRRYEDGFAARPGGAVFAPGDDPDLRTFRAALGAALLDLPAEQRAVVSLKLWQGLTFQEIAEATGTSPHTAASRYRYALDKLRGHLRPIYEEIR
ncbi:MAG: sigma-70 family RNA polymerase sigma factor [Gluconacetobacter diazotrophicus]|nr:sigma-70 family RNA polymerase sigma factor [Gluconacetobacter diazotrophicus]